MKTLLTIFTLVFTLMFSSTSFAEWTKVTANASGTAFFYVDFEGIRKHDGYVYFWSLVDFLRPTEGGDLSGRVYYQSDCKIFRFKYLSAIFHKQPMGRDAGVFHSPTPEWIHSKPGSVDEVLLQRVCLFAKWSEGLQ